MQSTTLMFILHLFCVPDICSKRIRGEYMMMRKYLTKHHKTRSLCPHGTTLQSNASTLYGINFEHYWYPWIYHVFPRCWESLQPLLCLKAREDFKIPGPRFYKPCKHVCHVALYSCWMLEQFTNNEVKLLSNEFINCDLYNDTEHSDCNANITTSKRACNYPLHESYCKQDVEIVKNHQYQHCDKNSVSGCSLLCDCPLNIHQPYDMNVYIPIVVLCCIGFFMSLFTILTFVVDWKCQNRYPAVILFILNILFLICLTGWMLQFFGLGNLIRCSPGNYHRRKEPKYAKTLWCALSFILIYFSSIAISCWFVILAYAWYISFKALGSTKNFIHGKVRYFHAIAWSISLLLTGMVIFLGEVDSHPFTNICFVGYSMKSVRIIFVYIPFIISLLLGETFLVCSIMVLMQVYADCSLFLIPRAAQNITRTIRRLAIYGLNIFLVVIVPLICYIFADYNDDEWTRSHNRYIQCVIVKSMVVEHPFYPRRCVEPDKRKLFYFYLDLICLFLGCIATNSWTWTNATYRIWLKYWKGLTTADVQQQLQISWYRRMQKKKIAPFVPPVNPDNPLETHVTRRPSDNYGLNMIYPPANDNQTINNVNGPRRRDSDDIRSVFELFSARRGTKGSLESESKQLFQLSAGLRSQSVASLQNYGHLAYGNVNNSDCNLFRKMSSANFASMQLKNNTENGRCPSNLTLTHLKNIHDNLLTPISLAHRNSIVADCIPYAAMQAIQLAGRSTNQSANRPFSVNEGMEPCSITSSDEL